MDKKFAKIWQQAVPYLKQGIMRDYVLHTKWVVKAMELLISEEGGEKNILIPAAILHDVGFSKVPRGLQCKDLAKKREAQRLHLVYFKEIARPILKSEGYTTANINKIIDIIKVHKFHNPRSRDKRLLIDADNLSDTFEEQFLSDLKIYGPANYGYREKNKYYTQTAQRIARANLLQLKKLLALG